MTPVEVLSEHLGSLLSFLPPEKLVPTLTKEKAAFVMQPVSPKPHSLSPPAHPRQVPCQPRKQNAASVSMPEREPPKREEQPQRSRLSDSEKMKLKNHHQLMRTMVKMEDDEGEVRKTSLLHQSFTRMNKGMRDIRATANAKLPKIAPIKLTPMSNFALNPHEAHFVVSESERSQWMKRRGIEGSVLSTRHLVNFVKELFEVLDESGVGSIELTTFVENMLSLGLCPSVVWMRRALDSLRLTHAKVYKNELLAVLKKDIRHFTYFRIIEWESGYSSSPPKVMAKLPSSHQSAATMLHSSQHFSASSPTLNWISVSVTIIEQWWRELDTHRIGLANVNRTSEFLVSKQLAGNKFEGKNIMEEIRPLGNSASIGKDHFERLFAPAIFLGALCALESELSTGELAMMPFKVKIVTFQRKLLLAGIVTADRHKSPSRVLVDALSSFRKETDGRASKADSARLSLDGVESLNLSQLDEDPNLGGQPRKREKEPHKRSQSELRTPPRKDNTTADSLRHHIHGKVFFPSVRKLPRPRDMQIPRENFILEKYERAMDLKNESEEFFHS